MITSIPSFEHCYGCIWDVRICGGAVCAHTLTYHFCGQKLRMVLNGDFFLLIVRLSVSVLLVRGSSCGVGNLRSHSLGTCTLIPPILPSLEPPKSVAVQQDRIALNNFVGRNGRGGLACQRMVPFVIPTVANAPSCDPSHSGLLRLVPPQPMAIMQAFQTSVPVSVSAVRWENMVLKIQKPICKYRRVWSNQNKNGSPDTLARREEGGVLH